MIYFAADWDFRAIKLYYPFDQIGILQTSHVCRATYGTYIKVSVLSLDESLCPDIVSCHKKFSLDLQNFLKNIFGARDLQTSENYALRRAAMDNQAMLPDAASAILEKKSVWVTSQTPLRLWRARIS